MTDEERRLPPYKCIICETDPEMITRSWSWHDAESFKMCAKHSAMLARGKEAYESAQKITIPIITLCQKKDCPQCSTA